MMSTQSASIALPVETRSDSKRDSIGALFMGERLQIACSAFLVSLSAALELLPHLVVYAAAIEVFSDKPDSGQLAWLATVAFGGVLLRFVLLGGGYILSHAAAFRILRVLRLRLVQKLGRVSGAFYRDHNSGDLKKTVIDDVGALELVFAHVIPELASGVFVPFLAAAILFVSDWRLGALALAMLPIGVLVQATFMRGIGQAIEEWHGAEARANAGVLEFIRGVVTLKAFNRSVTSLERVRGAIYAIRDLANEMTRRSMAGYALFFALLSNNLIVVLPAGVWLYLSQDIALEQFVLFVALGTGMLSPLMKLLFLFGSLQQVSAGWRRVRSVLDADEFPHAGESTAAADSTVRFERVGFRYPGREEDALNAVDLELASGTVTAVVGPSGAGKTTLLRLLLREFDVARGAVTIGGQDIRSFAPEALHQQVAHVSQETTLFDESAFENLRLARPSASREAVEEAAKRAHVHEVLKGLPGGYDTPLGDRGGHLSGGERQRLAIARALLKDAPVLLLDEVTASVDPESERGIQEGLSYLARNRVVLVVAHRLRTVTAVHQIIVMDGGQIIDSGTHDELLERCAVYKKMWNAQSDAQRWSLGGSES